MRASLAIAMTALLLAGCIGSEGGLTDFAVSPDCPEQDVLLMDDVTVGTLVGSGRVGSDDQEFFTIDVADRTGWNAREAACVDAIQVTIEWTNTPEHGADLFVGVQVPGAMYVTGHDEQQLAGDGTHQESVLAPTVVDGFTGQGLLEGLRVGIHSDWLSASRDGLPVTITTVLIV